MTSTGGELHPGADGKQNITVCVCTIFSLPLVYLERHFPFSRNLAVVGIGEPLEAKLSPKRGRGCSLPSERTIIINRTCTFREMAIMARRRGTGPLRRKHPPILLHPKPLVLERWLFRSIVLRKGLILPSLKGLDQ